jgi:hypothetical protein
MRSLDYSVKLLCRILVCMILIGISFFALAAMLGQLDIILTPWYTNPGNTWEMPLPLIFNQGISALLGWEIIYAIISIGTVAILALGVYAGWNLRTLVKKESIVTSEDIWRKFRNAQLSDMESYPSI